MDRATQGMKRRHWWRVLRPLFWWFILVLVLYGIRTHQRLMQKTRLGFSISLEGHPIYSGATATFDGEPATSGERIPLGWHTFRITHPKADPYSTNLFVWYGGRDLGQINLKRAKGTLAIKSNPRADLLVIRGPEFNTILTNSGGVTLNVPTDRYEIRAKYDFSEQQDREVVEADSTSTVRFAPSFGGVNIASTHSNATFHLNGISNDVHVNGELPLSCSELPTGEYELAAECLGERQTNMLRITAGHTNRIQVAFKYGAATLETEPEGATVLDDEGRNRGTTPITLLELPPGRQHFSLQRDHYETLFVQLRITADQTNAFHTNLISQSYARSMKVAKSDLANRNYRQALAALSNALHERPGDSAARRLKRTISLQRAKQSAARGDFAKAIATLESLLASDPDNAEAKKLLADCKTRQTAQMVKLEAKRTREVFDAACAKVSSSRYFTEHETTTTAKSPDEVARSLLEACGEAPKLKVLLNRSPETELHELLLGQGSANPFVTSRRECLVVIGKGDRGKTAILFKVLEYQRRMTHNLATALLGGSNPNNWIPLDSSHIKMTDALRGQIRDGVRMMQEKINQAIRPVQ